MQNYDSGSVDMRSKAMHDRWQKLLQCKLIIVNGAQPMDEIIKNLEL